ncbi:MAG: flagellar FliJ family protein, partial [Phycisphaerae bacterium]|nr:flagellar FliJ family protein [Phycisphaerae bacterium]
EDTMSTSRQERQLSVLWRLRRQDEDSARQAFESARSQVDAAETHVRRLRSLLEAHNAEARSALGSDPAALARYRESVGGLTAALADANRYLAEARVDLEHKRTALEQAMCERKGTDAARRRSAAAAASDQQRAETGAADDLHATRAAAQVAVQTPAKDQRWVKP